MVSLRQLRYLESLAETRHFGHAAEACAVSQPALSMQIKELEDELRLSLVERRKSGVELTDQGEEIVRRARTILASVRDLVDYAKHQEGVLAGVLKSGRSLRSLLIFCPQHCPSCSGAFLLSICNCVKRSPRISCTSS